MKKLNIGVLLISYASQAHTQIYGVAKSYMRFAEHIGERITGQAANVRIVTPDQNPSEMGLDLVILPGGPDLSLAIRPEGSSYIGQGKDCQTYTAFYSSENFGAWVDSGIPLFGICLGSQALANHFGCKLATDGVGHQIPHNGTHGVLVMQDKAVETKTDIHHMNSRHHQFILLGDEQFNYGDLKVICYGYPYDYDTEPPKGVSYETLASRLARNLTGTDSSLAVPSHIEAFRHKSKKIAAVQWHPEDMKYPITDIGDSVTWKLINWLLKDNGPGEDPVPAPKLEEYAVA